MREYREGQILESIGLGYKIKITKIVSNNFDKSTIVHSICLITNATYVDYDHELNNYFEIIYDPVYIEIKI